MSPACLRAGVVWLTLALTGVLGCATHQQKKLEAHYGPSESILEVVATLRRHVPDDTYRFPPATDFTGRNVYLSALLRLESIERIHADALRTGYMSGVIAFSKGRALEQIRGYDVAAMQYREAARLDEELAAEALRSAKVCDGLAEARQIGLQPVDPLDPDPEPLLLPAVIDADWVVTVMDQRTALLSYLLEENRDNHYEAVIREEIERGEEIRASWFEQHRYDLPNGQVRSISELQRVVSRNAASKEYLRHMLRLAELYDILAHEYVEAVPPVSLDFDPARFQDLVDPAVHLYESVASNDGSTEKLEASRRLEAFLAFTLVVDRDRFTF